jgi:hypothetical protein
MLRERNIQIVAGPGAPADQNSPYRTITAKVHGSWAAHKHLDVPSLWVLTCLPIGLNLPPDWCSFPSEELAVAAMVEIEQLSNSWHIATQEHFSDPGMGRKLREIARRNGAVEGPLGLVGKVDHSALGRKLHTRPNGYSAVA